MWDASYKSTITEQTTYTVDNTLRIYYQVNRLLRLLIRKDEKLQLIFGLYNRNTSCGRNYSSKNNRLYLGHSITWTKQLDLKLKRSTRTLQNG